MCVWEEKKRGRREKQPVQSIKFYLIWPLSRFFLSRSLLSRKKKKNNRSSRNELSVISKRGMLHICTRVLLNTHTSQSILFTFKHVFCIYHRKQSRVSHSRGFASHQVFQQQETIFDCKGGRGRSCGNGKASRCGSGGAFFYFFPLIFLRSRVHWRSRKTNFCFDGQSGRRNEVLARRFRHRKIRISLAFLCSFLIRTRGRDTVDISKGKILKTFSLFATSSCCDLRRSSERYERTQRVVRELFELFRAWEE